MTGDQQEQPPPYRRALEAARALGRADGRREADLLGDLPADPGPAAVAPWCRGLDPERFAALVWGTTDGPSPAGVVLNAPLWYALGFREALAVARSRQHRDPPVARPSGSCRPPVTGGPSRPPASHVVPRPRSEPT